MGRGREADDVEVDAAGRLDAAGHVEVVIRSRDARSVWWCVFSSVCKTIKQTNERRMKKSPRRDARPARFSRRRTRRLARRLDARDASSRGRERD